MHSNSSSREQIVICSSTSTRRLNRYEMSYICTIDKIVERPRSRPISAQRSNDPIPEFLARGEPSFVFELHICKTAKLNAGFDVIAKIFRQNFDPSADVFEG